MFTNRRIPTLAAIGLVVVLVAGVALSVAGLGQVTKFFNFASSGTQPSRVAVVNVNDASFTVTWLTDKEEGGSVAYGPTQSLGSGVAIDDRNLTKPDGKYRTHFVRISGLAAGTKYFYKIQPGGTVADTMTGAKLAAVPAVDPIYGQVTGGGGALAVWEAAGAGKLAAIVKDDGNYVLPIGNARTQDLTSFFSLASGTAETITIDNGDGTSTISCVGGKDRPLPTVTMGMTVDCQAKTAKPSLPSATKATASGGFKVPTKAPTTTSGSTDVNISNGETVSTPLPTISGKAGPGQVVKIKIESETPYSGTVIADPAGNWSWTPPANLAPGDHMVTITVVNADGTTQTVTRQFTVNAGSSILPITSGTPSATLTHKACVNNSCMVVDGLGSDTCTGDNDCLSTTPVATPPATPPPAQTTPPTGAVENTLLLVAVGMLFLIVGTRLWKTT